jgi:hypothetical protein
VPVSAGGWAITALADEVVYKTATTSDGDDARSSDIVSRTCTVMEMILILVKYWGLTVS